MRRRKNPATKRRGMILLVILVMLTLFAIAGLTFVLYADAASESSRFARDAEALQTGGGGGGPDMDPTAAFNYFLGQLIYGTTNDVAGAQSSLRGHSLAENMYGSYDALITTQTPMDVPWDGTGRLHNAQTAPVVAGQDEYSLVNYMWFQGDGFVHDPARYGFRTDPTQPFNPVTDAFTGGQNAPYTYPDLNSMYLAYINQATGQVVVPSYHRHWLFNNGLALNDATNPNWTNASGKYQTLRPRPQDMGAGFPYPTDATGDVKNLVGAPGGNDSIWIDIGAPELTTAAGLKYKMLVAPLVLDLDNRVNLNVVGNVLASAQANPHGGNQHWGQWEVNVSRVLTANGNVAAANEWQNLILGNGTLTGRYGAAKLPAALFPLSGSVPKTYAPGDLNAVIDPPNPGAYTATPAWSLPGGANTVPYQSFPYFPPQGYGNGGNLETENALGQPNHPMFYNPMFQLANGPNRLFPVSSHGSLLWAGVRASPSSDLVQLCPNNYQAGGPNTAKYIDETTVLSMDLDRAGAAPYIFDPTAAPYTITYNVTGPNAGKYTYGAAGGQTFPLLAQRNATPPNSEFNPATWQSVLPGALTRLNLTRSLAPYPASGVQPPDRQQFATDIFNRLLAVTGMTAVAAPANIGTATPQQYASLRWLAQLSANIVDYMDSDDVMTAFQWTTTPQPGDTGWVFGTELPKLVLNEVYLQYNNDATDPGTGNRATKPFQMNVWVELLNPLPSGNNTDGTNNNAVLQNTVNGNPNPVYQVVLTKPNAHLRDANNLVGDPDGAPPPFTPQPYSPTGVYSSAAGTPQVLSAVNTVTNNGAGNQLLVTPVGQAYSGPSAGNAGFYVLGPADGTIPSTLATQQFSAAPGSVMTYAVPLTDPNANFPNAAGIQPTILLQRLANPNLPYQPVATAANYNPYVTVDYVDMTKVPATVNDARTYTLNAKVAPPDPSTRFSYGRNQPYAGSTLLRQQPNPANPMGVPQTTFYRHNAVEAAAPPSAATPGQTLQVPFDWLVHLDRPVISPIELLYVSAFKPHELTQQFSKSNLGTGVFNHYAPWFDQDSRLYRFLEFVKSKNATPGIVSDGRIPGKVNINTLDARTVPNEVFRALGDAEPGNTFYGGAAAPDSFVDLLFQQIMVQRTPGYMAPNGLIGPGPTGGFGAGQNDSPFWGMAMGRDPGSTQYPLPPGGQDGTGIGKTLLSAIGGDLANPTGAIRLFAVDQGNSPPYQQLELLDKLYNSVTTRSNVYAVWLTVGFFQVLDDTTIPMKLGPEVNQAQGTNIRHHMFAIVDRTQVQTFTTATTGAVAPGAGVAINVPPTVLDPRTNRTWQIQAGTTLVYDPGAYNINPNPGPNPNPAVPNEETVVVQNVGGVLVANFKYPHNKGATVISRGHPGPWLQYDAGKDSAVVPYFVIID
jgi:hypothetical protein